MQVSGQQSLAYIDAVQYSEDAWRPLQHAVRHSNGVLPQTRGGPSSTPTAATAITTCCPSPEATLWRVKGRFLAKLDTPHRFRLDGLS